MPVIIIDISSEYNEHGIHLISWSHFSLSLPFFYSFIVSCPFNRLISFSSSNAYFKQMKRRFKWSLCRSMAVGSFFVFHFSIYSMPWKWHRQSIRSCRCRYFAKIDLFMYYLSKLSVIWIECCWFSIVYCCCWRRLCKNGTVSMFNVIKIEHTKQDW